MRFRKGCRYRRSEVEGLPTTPIILCVVVSRSCVTLWVSRSYVTRLFEVDTDFKNIFTLKKVYGSLELIVNICVSGKMRIAALISIENLLF